MTISMKHVVHLDGQLFHVVIELQMKDGLLNVLGRTQFKKTRRYLGRTQKKVPSMASFPEGVSTSNVQTKTRNVTPTKPPLVLSDKLKFNDYHGTDLQFRTMAEYQLQEKEQIIIDNLYIAAARKDLKHTIAALNGLTIILAESRTAHVYVVFQGKKKGIFDTWAETQSYIHGYPEAKWKKYESFQEAQKDARTYIQEPYFLSTGLEKKQTEQPTVVQPKTITELRPQTQAQKETLQVIELKKQIVQLEEQLAVTQIELENSKKALQQAQITSYAGKVSEKPETVKDLIALVAHDLEAHITAKAQQTEERIENGLIRAIFEDTQELLYHMADKNPTYPSPELLEIKNRPKTAKGPEEKKSSAVTIEEPAASSMTADAPADAPPKM